MSEGQLTPPLRFPEFSKSWIRKSLGEITTFHKGKGLPKADIKKNGKLECIRYGELYTHYCELIFDIKSRTDISEDALFLSQANDVIIPASGETAVDIATASCVKKHGVALGGDINILRTDLNGTFLAYYLNNCKKTDIARYAQGISVIHLYSTQLKLLKLHIPVSDSEVDKIADFLSAINKKISQLKEKHTLLQQYKKGIMQQLFSQKMRFKDDNGNAFPDWQVKPLSEILTLKLREVKKPKVKYLAIGIRSHMKGTFQKPNFNPDSIAMEKLYEVKHNDLIVNITFAWEGAIAIVKAEDDGGLVSHRFPTYTFNKNQAIHEYLRHIILQKRFKYMLDLISPGGAGRNRVLSKKEFLKLKWNMPCVNEQIKIASFLDTLDKKTDQVAEQIEQTEQFKKGLLQQMFV